MAISSSNLFLPILAFITIFLTLLHRVNSADSLSFTFNSFRTDQKDLILQGDASINTKSKALQLTKVNRYGKPVGGSVGRALYYAPVHLWKSSAVVASFETTFTFLISSPSTPADGLTFFIAKPDTTIPPGSGGRLLGLFGSVSANSSYNDIVAFKSSSDKVVAVEFDTFSNDNVGDPHYPHIGIDINSPRSSAYRRWGLKNGATATAHITYNSASKRLSVVSSYPNRASVTVSYYINLKTVLPELVRVGFSAATGEHSQINNILSWSFKASWSSNDVEKDDAYIASVV